MAGLKSWSASLVPASLFGRLALLLMVAVVSSHLLALGLIWELRPAHPVPAHWGDAPAAPPGAPEHHGHHGPPTLGLLLDISVRLGALTLAAWVGARWLAAPVSRLADAARALGRDIHRPPLTEQGTTECREATRVFNQMQSQICQQLRQRDQFVAAVSHDLRTPLTRLALRVQSLTDGAQRKHFGRDIAEMDAMIRATLDYLRGAADAEPRVALDLAALLDSMRCDRQEMGQDVDTLGPLPALRLQAQASALRRCLDNLLDNALRYGLRARIRVQALAPGVQIDIEDAGPGIPEAELAQVLTPFYRLESSRNRDSGGVGLGLATAHDIAVRHGGTLTLRNLPGGGLCACLHLGLTAAQSVAGAPLQ